MSVAGSPRDVTLCDMRDAQRVRPGYVVCAHTVAIAIREGVLWLRRQALAYRRAGARVDHAPCIMVYSMLTHYAWAKPFKI